MILKSWGRNGFDGVEEIVSACRGWSVGLVKSRLKLNCRSAAHGCLTQPRSPIRLVW